MKKTWEVTHAILRAEYYTVEVEAETEEEAIDLAKDKIEGVTSAEYEPGDVWGEHPCPWEAHELPLRPTEGRAE